MSNKRYTEEFKVEAVKQITERGHAVADVAGRLGVSIHSLYARAAPALFAMRRKNRQLQKERTQRVRGEGA